MKQFIPTLLLLLICTTASFGNKDELGCNGYACNFPEEDTIFLEEGEQFEFDTRWVGSDCPPWDPPIRIYKDGEFYCTACKLTEPGKYSVEGDDSRCPTRRYTVARPEAPAPTTTAFVNTVVSDKLMLMIGGTGPSQDLATLQIYDLSGMLVMETRLSNDAAHTAEIPMGNLSQGIYFARLYHQSQQLVMKFVKH